MRVLNRNGNRNGNIVQRGKGRRGLTKVHKEAEHPLFTKNFIKNSHFLLSKLSQKPEQTQ